MQHIFISAFFSFCLINCIIIAIINKYISQSPFLSVIIKIFIIYCMHCSAKPKQKKSYDQIRISTVRLPCTLIEQIALKIKKIKKILFLYNKWFDFNSNKSRYMTKLFKTSQSIVVVLYRQCFLFIEATKEIFMAFQMYIIHKCLHMTLKSDGIR